MKVTESVEGFEDRFNELVEACSIHPKHEEISERFDSWCDIYLEEFDDLHQLELASLEYIETLCLEYGVTL